MFALPVLTSCAVTPFLAAFIAATTPAGVAVLTLILWLALAPMARSMVKGLPLLSGVAAAAKPSLMLRCGRARLRTLIWWEPTAAAELAVMSKYPWALLCGVTLLTFERSCKVENAVLSADMEESTAPKPEIVA